MPDGTSLPRRRSIRLPQFDYSQPGAYFITIAAFNRAPVFGTVSGDVNNAMVELNLAGKAIAAVWRELPKHYPHVKLGEMIVMPDHFHSIIYIIDESTVTRQPLSEIVRAFKSFSARRVNTVRQTPGAPVWQRNYFERVIRNETELWETILYIRENPRKAR